MSKPLRDIVSKKLEGVNKSSETALTLGKDPGVDYAPKAKGERDGVAKHKVEKHEDRAGNGDEVYNASKVKVAKFKKQNDSVYESKEECNGTGKGKACPLHGDADCSKKSKVSKEDGCKKAC